MSSRIKPSFLWSFIFHPLTAFIPGLSMSFKSFSTQLCHVIPFVSLALLHHLTQLTTPLLYTLSSALISDAVLSSLPSPIRPAQQKLCVLRALCSLRPIFSTSVFCPASWGRASTSGTDVLACWLVHV